MTSLADLLAVRAGDPLPLGAWSGEIADGATSTTEPVWVVVPAIADDQKIGPCRWMPAVEATTIDGDDACAIVYPLRGNPCLVVFDENNDAWVAAYWTGP